jgi:DNA mismatch repair protein MutL
MPIQLLSDEVASQIAAGEVVERPASVVKELVENALDAGARSIRVDVEGGGRRLLRISDDGSGIAAHEVELAFARHATSKLRTIDDLDSIQTLGFRGEALASISAVAQVSLATCHKDESAGTLIRLEGGRKAERRSIGAPKGTVITVENLFFNTPARLKFMKAETTERRHIDAVVTRYAMAYPNVRFTLSQDGRVTFSTSGNGSLRDVLVESLGIEMVREMVQVAPPDDFRHDLNKIVVYGFAGAPHLNRNSRAHMTLFINGRHIQDIALGHAIKQAYHTLIPQDRFPVAILMIAMPPEWVDVNVHPTKAEVRFHQPETVFAAVQRAVRRAVMSGSPVPQFDPNRLDTFADEPDDEDTPTAPTYTYPTQPAFELHTPDAGRRTQQIGSQTGSQFGQQFGQQSIDSAPTVQGVPDWSLRPRTLPPLRVVGQIGGTYIIAEGPAGLYLIDQHAAHERILYEQYMEAFAAQRPTAQHTLEGTLIQLPLLASRLLEENLDTLNAIGFDIEPFGGNSFRVRAVPAMLADRLPEEALATILEDLDTGAEPAAETIEAKLIRRACKAGAIKAGQTLSYDEMIALIRQLERCENPRTCPHGRPTLIHMSAEQLAREFGRT